jgi:hypothetical protein
LEGIVAKGLQLPEHLLGELGVHALGLRPGDELLIEGGHPLVSFLV